MISIGDMPPEDADSQPAAVERKRVVDWITAELRKIGRGPDPLRLIRPEFGNRVNHDDLFSGQFKGPAFSPSRIWRKTPQIHAKFERILRLPKGTSPFSPKGGHGFQDYAMLLANESTISAMRINANNYAADLLDGKLVFATGKDGKPDKTRRVRDGKGRWQEFNSFLDSDQEPTDELIAAAVTRSFELLFNRKPTEADASRYTKFLRQGIEIAGRRQALEAMITAVILSPEFIYRMELGLGKAVAWMAAGYLSPNELAFAIAFALTDSPHLTNS